ncbi:MAG: right-handed parallel beta-helix repeat-containing protein [Proteobacteria bacterium]|nr:right-handed parallel beta-helix repeat-containing protein [Pseudomonadota bacterium]
MRQFFVALMASGIAACTQQGSGTPQGLTADEAAFQKHLQEQFLDAQPGTVIEIPAGRHPLDRVLTLRANGVTVRGAGTEQSVLSFKNEISGPEGMLVYGNDFTVENLTIEDTKGDGLKINDGDHITIRGVRVVWTGGPRTTNGAYGIYPVKSHNILIENSQVQGASDAGIYVGQSTNVIVRNCQAEQNVAGIEIENTIGADVHDNTATGNTGGILVFNMPNLSQPGHSTRVFHNKVLKNNLANFAARGAAVASVPAGAGVVVNSNSKVEIFDNDIADNQTANLIISAYFSTNYYNKPGIDPHYDPYPRAIFVYDNRFSGGGDSPDGLDLKTLKVAMFGLNGHFPDILWDGYRDEKNLVNGQPPPEERICIQNGSVIVLNADGPHKYKNPSTDMAAYKCELPKLAPIELAARS